MKDAVISLSLGIVNLSLAFMNTGYPVIFSAFVAGMLFFSSIHEFKEYRIQKIHRGE